MKPTPDDAADRRTELMLDELLGSTPAPDLQAIQKRVVAAQHAGPTLAPAPRRRSAALIAASILLGAGATLAVALFDRQEQPAQKQQAEVEEPDDTPPPVDPSAGSQPPVAGQVPTVIRAPEKSSEELPRGTDPADLAAMRRQKMMLAAEAELRRKVAAGLIKISGRILRFEEFSSWPYTEGLEGMPKKLNQLDDKSVTMLGFMLPIDELENMTEFVLVESLWSCCFGQPPDTNGIVRVVLQGATMDYLFEPVKVEGKFQISATMEDGFCVDVFQIEATSVTKIE